MPIILPFVLVSYVNETPNPYKVLEDYLAKIKQINSLVSYDPKYCTVNGTIPEKISENCQHVIVGKLEGETVFQVFIGSPYKSFFIFAGADDGFHSLIEYDIKNVVLTGSDKIPVTGKCIEGVFTPYPYMSCNIEGKDIKIDISFNTDSSNVIK